MKLDKQIEELTIQVEDCGCYASLDAEGCKRVLKWLKELKGRRKENPVKNVNYDAFKINPKIRIDPPGFTSRKDFEGE